MATTSRALVYRMQLDDSKFTKGMNITQKELTKLKRTMTQILKPTERAAKEIAELDNLLRKDALTLELHARAVQRVKEKYGLLPEPIAKTTRETGKFRRTMSGLLTNVGTAATAGFFAAIAGGAAAAVGWVRSLSTTMSELGSELMQQRKLGIDPNTFGAAKVFASGDLEANVGNIVDAFKDMRVRISEAVENDTGSQATLFNFMGLDPNDLLDLSAADQFKTVAAAIRNIRNETDQLRVVDELFGDPGFAMLEAIKASSSAFDDAAAKARRFGLVLTSDEAAAVEKASSGLADLALIGEGIFTQLAVAAGDSFGDMIEELKKLGIQIIDFVKENKPLIAELFREATSWVRSFGGWLEWLSERWDSILATAESILGVVEALQINPMGRAFVGGLRNVVRDGRRGIAQRDEAKRIVEEQQKQNGKTDKTNNELREIRRVLETRDKVTFKVMPSFS